MVFVWSVVAAYTIFLLTLAIGLVIENDRLKKQLKESLGVIESQREYKRVLHSTINVLIAKNRRLKAKLYGGNHASR